jgi:hypothetical protein
LPCRRQTHSLILPFKQGLANRFLKFCNSAAQRRLPQFQFAGSAAQAALFMHCQEELQVIPSHIHMRPGTLILVHPEADALGGILSPAESYRDMQYFAKIGKAQPSDDTSSV